MTGEAAVLNKRKLKLLAVEPFPAVIETEQFTDEKQIEFTFVARTFTIGNIKILMVTFFSLEKKQAMFRVFFDKVTFIVELLTLPRKWSNATLEWLRDWNMGSGAVCADEQSADCIRLFFGADMDASPFFIMAEFQKTLRKNQLAARHKKETDKIDDRMKVVNPLPKNFDIWVNEVALDFSRYIYYKRQTRRHISGFCTSCRQTVDFIITQNTPHENIRHNQQGKCPKCSKAVIYKAVGKTKHLTDTTSAALMQKTPTGFLVRSFYVNKRYNSHYQNPTLEIAELVRDFYDGREMVSFEFTTFKQTNNVRWCRSQQKFRLDYAYLYTRNIRRALADTILKYCCVYELAKNTAQFNIYRYLSAYVTYPAYEYLVKLRLFRFIIENTYMGKNNVELNFNGKDSLSILGINRIQLRQMQRINGGIAQYKLIKAVGEIGITLKDEQVDCILRMNTDRARIVEILRFVTPHKLINYINRCSESWRQATGSYRTPQDDITIMWDDYLQNCALLGYDMKNKFVLFPRDLKARHDEVMLLYKADESDVLNKAIVDLCDPLQNRYGFAWKGMLVRSPVSVDEIVADGHALRHCVGTGSYIKNMAKGKCFILFVRRIEKPDDPFFTVELRYNMMIQCRGSNNCGMTEEVKPFIAQWQKKKLKQRVDR